MKIRYNTMLLFHRLFSIFFLFFIFPTCYSQLVINEGTNKNYTSFQDEDQEFPDWIEIYNAGASPINLENYSLTDDLLTPDKWLFPDYTIAPGEHKTIFCSGKNRIPYAGMQHVLNTGTFTPTVGWNTHTFTTPFYWDGISNILVNTCAFNPGWTENSVFNQTSTTYPSCAFFVQDGNSLFCEEDQGNVVSQRPNIQFNNISIDNGIFQNSPTDYPAPYGNYYDGSKTQILYKASELLAAGLTAGDITSLSFDVVSTNPSTEYDYIDIFMKMTSETSLDNVLEYANSSDRIHTNFTISSNGEMIYLFSDTQVQLSSLFVNTEALDVSVGLSPDASGNLAFFQVPTPDATNNLSTTYSTYLLPPIISVPSGMYESILSVSISNPNTSSSVVYYTMDGSDPTPSSILYTGSPISVFLSMVVKARAFSATELASPTAVSSYFLGIDHVTPVLSIVTDNSNLYGADGIFDHWQFDWEKASYVEYFDTAQQLIFSQNAGLQIDGGAGGSRSNPQHSMRVELDDPVLGDGSVNYMLIPNRPQRTKYSKFYLRNGSNLYLEFPHKEACQEEITGGETNSYYSTWRPISVYINGAYFGLYELREKFDGEYFEVNDNANSDSTDILSLSYWNGGVLRAVQGSLDDFYTDYNAFATINPAVSNYWDLADPYFDLTYYTDYIIAQSWMGNKDWPYNNIKIYRSDATDYRWRFCTIDLESGFGPNGWSDCYDNPLPHLYGGYLFTEIYTKSIQNPAYKNYFINRFADIMNTSYHMNRVSAVENDFFEQTVIEMPNEYQRWGWASVPDMMNMFTNNRNYFLSQLSQRTESVRNSIQSHFSLNSQVDVTLNVYPEGAGHIKISTIVPDSLPWTGVYFYGNPVQITAYPNPGYSFEYWETNPSIFAQNPNASINVDISSAATFTAYFEVDTLIGQLAISEINYNSHSNWDAGDWVEFHNYGNGPLDLSGWKFTDNQIFHDYIFPLGSTIQAGEWIVICSDSIVFHQQNPGIQVFGQFDFNLNNSNEMMTVFNNFEEEIVSVHYYNTNPWPVNPNGLGPTLELYNDTLDPNLNTSWFEGCIAGSPGGPFVTPCTIVGLEDISQQDIPLKIYPNPSTGQFTINVTEADLSNFELDVTTIIGESVYHNFCQNNQHNIQIDLSNYPDGVYYVNLKFENSSRTGKIVIQSK